MTSSLPAQGLELLIYGMGTVIAFLALLVVATRLMSIAVLRYFPEPPGPLAAAVADPVTTGASRDPGSGTDPRLLAAAVAAVHMHRALCTRNPASNSSSNSASKPAPDPKDRIHDS